MGRTPLRRWYALGGEMLTAGQRTGTTGKIGIEGGVLQFVQTQRLQFDGQRLGMGPD